MKSDGLTGKGCEWVCIGTRLFLKDGGERRDGKRWRGCPLSGVSWAIRREMFKDPGELEQNSERGDTGLLINKRQQTQTTDVFYYESDRGFLRVYKYQRLGRKE
ncbi:hypothetical protein V2G26_015763 [Clonostachys chloroleuca]